MAKRTNFNNEAGNDSLTPVRPPSEDIIKGAGNDDQIKELQKNAERNPVDKQIGIPPSAYPGPNDGE